MSEIRYVRTDDIKRAVSGRETEVLDALGIDWRSGRPHIQCPYPAHADNDPSWRWDERRAHAICTCLTNGHADGIFDVVAKVERLEFEEAKIRVAELLQRNDLIHTKREGGSGQKVDAQSLLNARASLRDDRLPIIYLAHRRPEIARLLRPPDSEGREAHTGRRISVCRVRHRCRRRPHTCASHLSKSGRAGKSRSRYRA